ncbi:MAG: polysaccharide biosynthesis protein, partial [Candidatus Marinimicrobia bacterium]|nr:polysaccharide biosynthesis protein [Candidatus Neomarinimicrobiota bacterium]
MNYLKLINRTEHLFKEDINNLDNELNKIVSSSRFLVIGAAGTIGQATVKEIFKRNPIKLHAVDLSENNLVELVRDLRSTYGYINGDFKTYAIDCGSREFETLLAKENEYDYILNLSALKHVRSEKDPYTLMRMIDVNIFNTIKTIKIAKNINTKKYFCVSTDKASNPVNMMGASKRIMELFLMKESSNF